MNLTVVRKLWMLCPPLEKKNCCALGIEVTFDILVIIPPPSFAPSSLLLLLPLQLGCLLLHFWTCGNATSVSVLGSVWRGSHRGRGFNFGVWFTHLTLWSLKLSEKSWSLCSSQGDMSPIMIMGCLDTDLARYSKNNSTGSQGCSTGGLQHVLLKQCLLS